MSETRIHGKYPIDRPCSACSAGDDDMKYHDHTEPFREGCGPQPNCGVCGKPKSDHHLISNNLILCNKEDADELRKELRTELVAQPIPSGGERQCPKCFSTDMNVRNCTVFADDSYPGHVPVDGDCERCTNPWHDQPTPAAQPVSAEATKPKPIDGKFGWLDGRIVNLVSGEAIRSDEPLFILRARDHHALRLLTEYRGLASVDCNELHLAGIQQIIDRFSKFAAEHPERMKQPGVTRHLKLDPPPVAPPEAEGAREQNVRELRCRLGRAEIMCAQKEAEISRLTAERDKAKRDRNSLMTALGWRVEVEISELILHDSGLLRSEMVKARRAASEWESKATLADLFIEEKSGWALKLFTRAKNAEAANTELRTALQLALIPLAALVISGECVAAQTGLSEEVKQAVIEAHDAVLAALAKGE